jgi:two-component system osmolarity sensor histidine kinase EnvZ
MRIGLLWRTFLLFAALIVAGVLGIFSAYRLLESAPAEQRLAWEIASVVNLTRSALVSADPARRTRLLEALASEEEVRVLPLEPTDRIDFTREAQRLSPLLPRLKALLGDDTLLAGSVNDEAGVWVSFDISGDSYWLLLPLRRIDRYQGPGLALILTVTCLVSLLGALALSRLVDRPLANLSHAISAIGRGVQYDPLPEKGPAQLVVINREFNRLARDLERLESDRSIALAGISHDVRSPLTRLRMEVELAELPSAQRAAMVADIERIDSLVGQFVDYARSGQTAPALLVDAGVELEQLAARYAEVGAVSQDKPGGGTQRELRADIQHPLPWCGDPSDLTRAVGNLLDNALRHGRSGTGAGVVIHLSARREASSLKIRVSDSGPGIPALERERVLRPFERLDRARGDEGGSGLGLAIVHRIVRRYAGNLRLGEAPGGGLLVELTLPDSTEANPRRTVGKSV